MRRIDNIRKYDDAEFAWFLYTHDQCGMCAYNGSKDCQFIQQIKDGCLYGIRRWFEQEKK